MGGSTSGGSQPVTQQTTNTTPWSGAVPALTQAMSGGQNLYSGDIGYLPWPSETMAPLDDRTQLGLNAGVTLSENELGGSSGINAARAQAQQMIQSGGLTPGQTGFVAPGYQNVYNEASNQHNPYLLAAIAGNDRRIADRINSSMSGAGRYGSGAHTGAMAQALAEAANPILAQDYTQRQQTRLGALGGLQGMYGQGAETAGKYSQLMPSLDQARYAGADRMLGIGGYYQDRAQKSLENTINLYNATQARPWEQAARLNALATGSGQLGGTKVASLTQPAVPTSNRIFGGALAGAGLGSTFGLPGAAIGAGAGGLLGLLG